MKRFLLTMMVIISYCFGYCQLQTRWAKDVSATNALKEYPRPQMQRNNWTNLNGLWEYAILRQAQDDIKFPEKWEGKILVPYPIESALSGVIKRIDEKQLLWYRRKITVSRQSSVGTKYLLHFGAVDNEATVYVNGKEVGKHVGGYTAFSFDITKFVKSGDNELVVKVYDPSDKGVWPHGKQVSNPQNIYYTASSGIWQTVWMEEVPEHYISDLKLTPDIDKKELHIETTIPKGYTIVAIAYLNGNEVAKVKVSKNVFALAIKELQLWSPSSPVLYDLKLRLLKSNKVIDEVQSYFGMRKVSIAKDAKGYDRIFLNNQYLFNLGILDQGFWPDGLYTAPTDEALKFDIEVIKAMGFNTIRKHIKIEPARWYYHADKLGMLVWQDFVNPNQSLPVGAKEAFEQQGAEMMKQLYNYPSITAWVLFNEKWGAYDQQRLTEWVKKTDPTRLVNGHSGEILYVNEQLRSPSPNAWVSSDMADVHSYPDPMNAPAKDGRVQILGEFGGIGVFIPDHQWNSSSAWGYINEKPAGLKAKYTIMNQHVQLLEKEGLAGSIYTQPFDVEGEQNGLITYDREVIKIPFEELRKIHTPLNPEIASPSWLAMTKGVTAQNANLTEPGALYSELLQQYINGGRDKTFLKKLTLQSMQVGDKAGASRFSTVYISNLQAPLSEEDIQLVRQFTKSTNDAGFKFMNQNPEAFKKVIGERQFIVNMMNMVYKGIMEPMINASKNPDWNAMEEKVKPYGIAGEEIFLRAKTIHFLNNQLWDEYVVVAKIYLEKYGKNIKEQERKMLQQNIEAHQ